MSRIATRRTGYPNGLFYENPEELTIVDPQKLENWCRDSRLPWGDSWLKGQGFALEICLAADSYESPFTMVWLFTNPELLAAVARCRFSVLRTLRPLTDVLSDLGLAREDTPA